MVVVAAVVAVDKSGGQQWQWRTRDGSGRTGDAAEEIGSNGQHSLSQCTASSPLTTTPLGVCPNQALHLGLFVSVSVLVGEKC
jgi:hypothetical protein